MAIYHFSVKAISRAAGRSATASAAYRAGEKVEDLRTGLVHDYRRKRGVESATVILPAKAPAWAANRQALWNAAEQAETRKNSTVAREFELALPAELSAAQRGQLAHAFARAIVARHGCAADVAIHAPSAKGDARNHHAHILMTTRRLEAHGFTEKTRELDNRRSGEIEHWRREWALMANQHLEHARQPARIDHRTLEAQGLERDPTRHLGPAAVGYERRTGTPSRHRAEIQMDPTRQREIAALTQDLETTQQRLTDLEEARRSRAQALAEERAERERRRQAEERQAREQQRQQTRAEQERLERMTAKELAAEIQRLTPRPVEDVLRERFEVALADARVKALRQQVDAASQAAAAAQEEAASWREAHPVRARLHDAGLPHAYLAEQERIAHDETKRRQTLTPTLRAAEHQARQVADQVRPTIVAEQAPARVRLAELEQLRQRKAAQEEAQARQARELDGIMSAFKVLALNRQSRTPGYTDEGRVWKAAPEPLRRLVEDFNQRIPPAGRETALQFLREGLKREPAKLDKLRGLLDQQKERQQKRGRQH